MQLLHSSYPPLSFSSLKRQLGNHAALKNKTKPKKINSWKVQGETVEAIISEECRYLCARRRQELRQTWIMWHLQLQLHVNMGCLPEDRCPQMSQWSVGVGQMYNRWGDNLKFHQILKSHHQIQVSFIIFMWVVVVVVGVGWGGMNVTLSLLSWRLIILSPGVKRATKLLAVHLKLSSNSNPSFSAAQPVKIWPYSTHI